MADISKIQISSGVYDIKDTIARNKANQLELIVNDITEQENNKIIFISDSYGSGYNGDTQTTGDSFIDYFKAMTNYSTDNLIRATEGGAGFNKEGQAGHNFLQLLQGLNISSENKPKIKKIYVIGGVNDNNYSYDAIITKINEFYNYVASNFVNATLYVGCAGYSANSLDITPRENITERVLRAYSDVDTSHVNHVYLSGIENILHEPSFMSADGIHPNVTGYRELARFLVCNLKGINYVPVKLTQSKPVATDYTYQSSLSPRSTDALKIGKNVEGNITLFSVQGALQTTGESISLNIYNQLILTYGNNVSQDSESTMKTFTFNRNVGVPIFVSLLDNASTFHVEQAILQRNQDGATLLAFNKTISYTIKGFNIPYQTFIMNTQMC